MLKIYNSYLVELNFTTAPGAGAPITFKDVPFLNNVYIYGIECITASQMTTSPTSNPIATQANIIKGSITIVEGNTEVLFQVPNGQLITQNNAGIIKEFRPIKINLTKSSVQMYAAGIAAGESICYNFIYLYPHELKQYLAEKK